MLKPTEYKLAKSVKSEGSTSVHTPKSTGILFTGLPVWTMPQGTQIAYIAPHRWPIVGQCRGFCEDRSAGGSTTHFLGAVRRREDVDVAGGKVQFFSSSYFGAFVHRAHLTGTNSGFRGRQQYSSLNRPYYIPITPCFTPHPPPKPTKAPITTLTTRHNIATNMVNCNEPIP